MTNLRQGGCKRQQTCWEHELFPTCRDLGCCCGGKGRVSEAGSSWRQTRKKTVSHEIKGDTAEPELLVAPESEILSLVKTPQLLACRCSILVITDIIY